MNPSEEVNMKTTSQGQISVNWGEGQEGDFQELHAAIAQEKTKRFLNQNQLQNNPPATSDDSSEEEEIVEPPESQPGPYLLWCAQTNNLTKARQVISVHPEAVNHADEDGYTALHRACYSKNPDMVRFLLQETDCDIHAVTKDGWTPLHSACRWNAAECVELLLNEDIDVNVQTQGGQTALHLAAFCNNARETLELLCMHPNVDDSVKNCQGDTAYDIAKRKGNCARYFELLEKAVQFSEEV